MILHGQQKRILITGGSGFLGRQVAAQLSKVNDVVATYASHLVQLPRCRAVRMNFLQPFTIEQALKDFDPEVIVHIAALADAAACEKTHDVATAVNVTGTELLMKALPNKDALFLYISTDLVFDGDHAPYNEDAAPEPVSQYGKTKRRAEQIVQRMWKNHVILRPALMFGKEQPAGRGSFLQWLDRAFQSPEPVTLFSDEVRTPVYAKDVVAAIHALVQNKGKHHIYHVGGPERITRAEFGKRLAALRGYDPAQICEKRLEEHHTGYPRPRDVSLNSGLIQESHFLRLTPIDDALREIFSL